MNILGFLHGKYFCHQRFLGLGHGLVLSLHKKDLVFWEEEVCCVNKVTNKRFLNLNSGEHKGAKKNKTSVLGNSSLSLGSEISIFHEKDGCLPVLVTSGNLLDSAAN